MSDLQRNSLLFVDSTAVCIHCGHPQLLSPTSTSSPAPQVAVKAGLGRIAVDEWVRFEAIGRIAALVNMLRQRLDAMLWEKIQNPRLDVAGSKLSEALVELLQTDGMG